MERETRITIEVEKQFKNRIKGKASIEGKSIKQLIVELLKQYLSG